MAHGKLAKIRLRQTAIFEADWHAWAPTRNVTFGIELDVDRERAFLSIALGIGSVNARVWF